MKKSLILVASFALFAFAQQTTAAKPVAVFEKCSSYGGLCGKSGKSRMVRFGYTDNWATDEIKGSVACLPENFTKATITGDPYKDENNGGIATADKICEEQ